MINIRMEIYLTKQTATNFFKIGITKNINTRLKQLQIGSGISLEVIHTFSTKYNYKLEATLHTHFNSKRINSEWFELTPEDEKEFISTCTKYEKGFDTIKDNYFFK